MDWPVDLFIIYRHGLWLIGNPGPPPIDQTQQFGREHIIIPLELLDNCNSICARVLTPHPRSFYSAVLRDVSCHSFLCISDLTNAFLDHGGPPSAFLTLVLDLKSGGGAANDFLSVPLTESRSLECQLESIKMGMGWD